MSQTPNEVLEACASRKDQLGVRIFRKITEVRTTPPRSRPPFLVPPFRASSSPPTRPTSPLQDDIKALDKRIYDAESAYLTAEHSQCGSVIRGFEGFISSKDNQRKRARVFKVEDRIFSLSSLGSFAWQEQDDPQDGGGKHMTGKKIAGKR